MKVNSQALGKGTLWLTAILLGFTACQSNQDTRNRNLRETNWTKPYPRPHMWVDPISSIADETRFMPMANALSKLVPGGNETDSIFYTAGEFRGMIEAFGKLPRIAYVDMFPIADPTGKLSILFEPLDSNFKVLGYFQLPPNTSVFDQTADGLTIDQAKALKENYKNTVMKWLIDSLDAKDCYNYITCDTENNSLYNTLHVSHWYNDFVELDTEFNYQSTDYSTAITGVNAFFSAKPKNPGVRGAYSNRLYLQFEFTVNVGGKNVEFYIDPTNRKYIGPDFPGIVPSQCKLTKGNDNGQLCPPTCNP